MSNPSNALTTGSSSQINNAVLSGPAESSSAPRTPVDVITYSYGTRMVYVAPAPTYDVRPLPIYCFAKFTPRKRLTDRPLLCVQDAINLAKETFRELKDVERERISLEVRVKLLQTRESKMAEIGRTAWPIVVASLVRFEIVQIRVTPMVSEATVAPSGSQAAAVGPPPYAPEKSGYSDSDPDSQTNVALYGPQIPSSQSPSPPSLVTRIVNFLTPRCFRSCP